MLAGSIEIARAELPYEERGEMKRTLGSPLNPRKDIKKSLRRFLKEKNRGKGQE